ncbi:Transcriptional regulator, TetR family [Roseibacterium elongatum DSM 19469]|uniref:Transcriptional regulator, TetR family n=1 Tax=Roseicyclus elongatus DSM 19469 TaxID=1294273 RepID=W8S415_9RHOB|nr:TetR/AcrR family transcriptional regulator [Roseibacterium elongatum]AHM03526.1 Transcriptional regulator, TetR family [Roseibacterium elongatum DSM 19469]
MDVEGQVKKGRKFDQVLEGARAVFMREGFEGASVDEIARDAGVSKATLYSYFPDKQHLFIAVLQAECDQQSEIEFVIAGSDMPVPDALRLICRTLVSFVLSDVGQDIFRVCVAEAQRFPELGHAFYESGPHRWNRKIAQFLESPAAQAMLDIEDSNLAADQLAQLCRTDLMLKKVFGIQTEVHDADIERITNEACETFLARYRRA